MSRHRDVRRMNNYEEYDGYDDVYGRSVEDDYCVSPSTAEFMYDRSSQHHPMAAFLPREDIPEEEDVEEDSLQYEYHTKRQNSLDSSFPDLDPEDEVRLRSCLDEIHSIVGDTFPDRVLIDAIISQKFDCERALNCILTASAPPEVPKPQRTSRRQRNGATPRSQQADNPFSNNKMVSTGDSLVNKAVGAIVESISKLDCDTGKSNVSRALNRTNEPALVLEQKQGSLTSVTEQGDNGIAGNDLKSKAQHEGPYLNINEGAGTPGSSAVSSKSNLSRARDAGLKLDPEVEYRKTRGTTKDLLNLVVIGHVDAGKSTLMGHLLCLLGAVNQKVIHKYEQESKKIGKASFMYAWVLDETGEERSRGVTMDIGYSKFETPTKIVTLIDAPGHKDFIPNMITGAAQADVAILVVDATRGEFETGFEAGGQTREHALLVRSLGVAQIIVAVNKLDTVNWNEDRYQEIVNTVTRFLVKQTGFKADDVTCIPCSGLTGENLVKSPEEQSAKWYTGPTLMEQIDKFRPPERPLSKPFRLCVSDVFKSQGSAFNISGKVETGFVQAGDKVMVMPIGETAVIKTIFLDDVAHPNAFAGDQAIVSLSGVDITNVTIGSVICDPCLPIRVCTLFRARIVVFNVEYPITRGFQAVLHYQSLCEPIIIKRLISQLHKNTGEVMQKKPRWLTKQSNAIVEISVNRPICIEEYKDIRELGRFMLRASGLTVAAGIVTQVL